MRQVHSEGVRERNNQRTNAVDHDHDDPCPRRRRDGRLLWCCPTALEVAREQGKFEDGEYIGEYE